MKIGDLVRWCPSGETRSVQRSWWKEWVGVIIDQTDGTAQYQTVKWNKKNGIITSARRADLEVINESR